MSEFENIEAQAETVIKEFKEATEKLFNLQMEVDQIIILLFLIADENGDYLHVATASPPTPVVISFGVISRS
jgi:hypothetical protein